MRRTHLRGHINILKRLLIHAGGFNLGLAMRHLIGSGTPRGLQDRPATVIAMLSSLIGVTRRWCFTISAWQPIMVAARPVTSPTTTIGNFSAVTTYTPRAVKALLGLAI
jgi:transposase